MIRLTINGDMVQFSSKLEVEPKLWNSTVARVRGRSEEGIKINETLDAIKVNLVNME